MTITKEQRDALTRVLEAEIDRENYGITARSNPSWGDILALRDAGIAWSGDVVTVRGKAAIRIVRRYASRKARGMYKQLKPKLEPVAREAAI